MLVARVCKSKKDGMDLRIATVRGAASASLAEIIIARAVSAERTAVFLAAAASFASLTPAVPAIGWRRPAHVVHARASTALLWLSACCAFRQVTPAAVWLAVVAIFAIIAIIVPAIE